MSADISRVSAIQLSFAALVGAIELEGQWLEVFNALDENGYDLHSTFPTGEFQHCL